MSRDSPYQLLLRAVCECVGGGLCVGVSGGGTTATSPTAVVAAPSKDQPIVRLGDAGDLRGIGPVLFAAA